MNPAGRVPIAVAPGERFGRLRFIKYSAKLRKGYRGLFRCDCGREHDARLSEVRRGIIKSCGCLRDEMSSLRRKHGMRDTPEYRSWRAMMARCFNPKSKGYARYGGRGITVCDQWRASFEAFYAHIGRRPPGTTLERMDNNGNYEPGNVRWATPKEQAANRGSA